MRVYLSQVAFHKNKHTASSFATSRMLINARGDRNNRVIRKSNKNHINNFIKETAKEKRVAYICYSFCVYSFICCNTCRIYRCGRYRHALNLRWCSNRHHYSLRT